MVSKIFFPICMTPMNVLEMHKQILGPYRNSSVSSFCPVSYFWALGHVGNSRVSSIVNFQCHLTQVYSISLVVTFILRVKNTDQAYTELIKLKFV